MLAAVSKCKVCVGLLGQLRLGCRGTVLWLRQQHCGCGPCGAEGMECALEQTLLQISFVEILCIVQVPTWPMAGNYLGN